ncbi:MAG TPA: response regulator [Gemmataceae bacterium]
MIATQTKGVLIVDPDVRARCQLQRELEARGWSVWVAADGAGAVRAYRERPHDIDVTLVDLQLPGLQGSQVLTELGRIAPGLLRCAMSVGVTPYTAAAFRRLTDTRLFRKPLEIDRLDDALRDLVGGDG